MSQEQSGPNRAEKESASRTLASFLRWSRHLVSGFAKLPASARPLDSEDTTRRRLTRVRAPDSRTRASGRANLAKVAASCPRPRSHRAHRSQPHFCLPHLASAASQGTQVASNGHSFIFGQSQPKNMNELQSWRMNRSPEFQFGFLCEASSLRDFHSSWRAAFSCGCQNHTQSSRRHSGERQRPRLEFGGHRS